MPGVCPRCFDARVKPVFMDPARRSLGSLLAGLIAVGCHPQRIIKHLMAQHRLHDRRN